MGHKTAGVYNAPKSKPYQLNLGGRGTNVIVLSCNHAVQRPPSESFSTKYHCKICTDLEEKKEQPHSKTEREAADRLNAVLSKLEAAVKLNSELTDRVAALEEKYTAPPEPLSGDPTSNAPESKP